MSFNDSVTNFVDLEIGEHIISLCPQKNVMQPSPYSFFLADYLLKHSFSNKVVLDLGTGTGILAMITALQDAQFVWATDVNDEIVHAARKNILLKKRQSG